MVSGAKMIMEIGMLGKKNVSVEIDNMKKTNSDKNRYRSSYAIMTTKFILFAPGPLTHVHSYAWHKFCNLVMKVKFSVYSFFYILDLNVL